MVSNSRYLGIQCSCVRVTNALTEALNRIARGIERDGRGYSYAVMRAKMLYRKAIHVRPRDEEGVCHRYRDESESIIETVIGRTYGASVDKLAEQYAPHDEAPDDDPG